MRSILPGRPQSSRQALSTVNWDGLRLVAYISGTNVIVFNGRKEVLQTISLDDAKALVALTIDEVSGQIAVADESALYIYKPIGRDYGDLRWNRSHSFSQPSTQIAYLSWASSNEVLVAGQTLALWSFAEEAVDSAIWTAKASSPIMLARCSPDGGLVATCGWHDRLVKIWRRLSFEQDSTRFDTSYLSHPAAVTSVAWRKSWHQEQHLDDLLYTFCSDNQIRVWVHSEHQSYTTLHRVITIDANISIQPRRLSVGSVSQSRFAFVLDSRDLARATERALTIARNGTDHALEHLVEIANRSPEVCLILDGRGHMSAWSIENAGLKNKLPAEKSNLALVDGVDIALPHQPGPGAFAEIVAFANNDAAASLCILVQQYAGQIDWYQGSFVDFFDTAAPHQRVQLMSCWSGHDNVIDRLVSRSDGKAFISTTEQNQVILWSVSDNKALVKVSEWTTEREILDAVVLPETNVVAVLHEKSWTIWNASRATALLTHQISFKETEAQCISVNSLAESDPMMFEVKVLCESDRVISYYLDLSDQYSNGLGGKVHNSLPKHSTIRLSNTIPNSYVDFASSMNVVSRTSCSLCAWSASGRVQVYDLPIELGDASPKPDYSLKLNLSNCSMAAFGSTGLLAVVYSDAKTLAIWNIKQATCEYHHIFTDLHEILGLQWYSSRAGLHCLAIQFSYHIVIVTQRLYAVNGDNAWTNSQVIATREVSSHAIEAMCWLEPCSVVAALGAQIFTFDVETAQTLHKVTKRVSNRSDPEAEGWLQLHNASLPVFSASVLGIWAKSANFPPLISMLQLIDHESKLLVTGEPISLESFTINEAIHQSTSAVRSVEQLASDFESLRTSVERGIAKISNQQLSDKQKNDFRRTMGFTSALLQNAKSLDTYSLSYLYHFLEAVDASDGSTFEIQPIAYDAIVMASISQTQEALLYFIFSYLEERNVKLVWPVLRSLGLFLFVSDRELIKTHFESVARAEYNRDADNRNPVNSSLYYLALDKKPILVSLWRRAVGIKEKEATMKLLSRDFKDKKWKETALKNAYALLSRRRFEYAAAWFLLAGRLEDAVNVCMNQLHDIQLAVAVARVWNDIDESNRVLNKLMQDSLPRHAVDSSQARWLALWAAVQQQDYKKAIYTMVAQPDEIFDAQIAARLSSGGEAIRNTPLPCQKYQVNEPTLLLIFYQYIRSQLTEKDQWTTDTISAEEESAFVLRCAAWYRKAGLDWHALQTVIAWKFIPWQKSEKVVEQAQPKTVATNGTNGVKSMLEEWAMPEESTIATETAKEVEPAQKKAPTQFVEPSADSLLDSFGF